MAQAATKTRTPTRPAPLTIDPAEADFLRGTWAEGSVTVNKVSRNARFFTPCTCGLCQRALELVGEPPAPN